MKNTFFYIVFIAITLFLSCGAEKQENKPLDSFVIPTIKTYSYDSLTLPYQSFDSMSNRPNYVVDIFPFCKEIRIDTISQKHASFDEKKIIFINKKTPSLLDDSLSVVIDYNSVLPQRYFSRSLSYTIYKAHDANEFPVYIINSNNKDRFISTKEGTEIATVFEAKDENGSWYAISNLRRNGFFCGTGQEPRAFTLPPKHFILLSYDRFDGDFNTKVRMRIKTGEHLYISKEFDANINPSHFLLKKSDAMKMFDGKDSSMVFESYFLGAKLKPITNLEEILKDLQKDSLKVPFEFFFNSPVLNTYNEIEEKDLPIEIRIAELQYHKMRIHFVTNSEIIDAQVALRKAYEHEIQKTYSALYSLIDEEGKKVLSTQKRNWEAHLKSERNLYNYFDSAPKGSGYNFGREGYFLSYEYHLNAYRSRLAELITYLNLYKDIIEFHK